MVPTFTAIACIVTLFLSLILPVLVLIIFSAKNKKQGIVSAWLLGAAGFLVTQVCIRLPILSALSAQDWFLAFSQEHPLGYVFSLAFTAGLFELAGRFAVAKLLQKKLTYRRSLAAGLGHGGIEAIVIVGMTYINNLVYIVMINTGTFDALISQTAAVGGTEAVVAQLELVRDSLITTSPTMFLLAGFERLLTMVAHAAMSMIVCRGVHTGKAGKAALVCLGIHTLLDLTAGISLLAGSALSQTTAYLLIYAILIIAAVLSLWILRDIRRRWEEPSPKGV